MTVILIVIILAVAGYVAYRANTSKFNKVKDVVSETLYKIEPAIEEIKEIVAKAEKVAPKNEVVKTAAQAVKKTNETIEKVKTKKTK